METLAISQSRFHSRLLFCTLIVAIAGMALAFQHLALKGKKVTSVARHQITTIQASAGSPLQVVVSGKRMSLQEKLAYDAAAVNFDRIERYQRANQ